MAATIDWMIPRFMPGDPVQSMLSRRQIPPEAVADVLAYYNNLFGLDLPTRQQYLNFWGSLLHGDLGLSVYLSGRSVVSVIMAAVPYTLALLIPAILPAVGGQHVRCDCRPAEAPRQRGPANRVHPHRYALHVAR